MPTAQPEPSSRPRPRRAPTRAWRLPFLVLAGAAAGLALFAMLWLSQRGDEATDAAGDVPGTTTREFAPLPTPAAPAAGNPRAQPETGRPATGRAGPPPMIDASPLPSAPGAVDPAPVVDVEPDAVAAAPPRGAASDPVPVSMPAPRFPPAALRRGAVGEVLLQVGVDADGRPAGIEVVQSSGSRDLDRAAIDAAQRWRFQPARRDGAAVAGVVNVPIRFDANR